MTNPMSAIIKFINGKNDKRDYLSGAIDYVTDATKTNGGTLVATQGCSRSHILDDILVNKVLHHKTHGKQGVHFVLAFPPEGNAKSSTDILNVTREIVSTVYPDYLAIMAVHTDSRVLHSHVILDAVNAVTGKKFSQGPGDLNRVKQKVNGILKANGFEIIRMSTNEFVDYTDHSSEEGFDFLELDESELITTEDIRAVSLDAEVINGQFYDDIWGGSSWHTPDYSYPTGGGSMNTTQETFNAPQPVEETGLTLSEQAVPAALCSPSNAYPNTTVVTGPTFHIRGSNRSDFSGLEDLVTSTIAQAQEHERESASLALAMQTRAQESGHPTNVTVIAGPIFDIDLCDGDNSPRLYYGDDGEVYD